MIKSIGQSNPIQSVHVFQLGVNDSRMTKPTLPRQLPYYAQNNSLLQIRIHSYSEQC